MAPQFNQPAELPKRDIGKQPLWFPNDLEDYLYHITFDFRKFTRRDITDRAFYGTGQDGTIRLPIPGNMIDNTAVGWGTNELNPVLGALIDYGARIRNKTEIKDGLRDQISAMASAMAKDGAPGALINSPFALALKELGATKAVEAVIGLTINPFMTVLFETPTFKRHSFQWRLAPRNKTETDTIRALLARFRFNMLPSLNNSLGIGLLLNYPNMCYVGLYPNNKDLYKFKPCVITAVSTNYAPTAPSFFKSTQAPVEVLLTVELLEMEYWVQEDVAVTWDTQLNEGGKIDTDASVDKGALI